MHYQTPTNRADWLLILRGLACVIVVLAHSNPPLNILAGEPWGWVMVMPGGIAVRLFFCLSGYLMGKGFYLHRYSLNGSGIYCYFRNRASRILPLYSAAFFFPAILITPEIFKLENWRIIFRVFTFTYNHTLPFTFNPPLWSLSTEVQFYLFVPLLYYYFRYGTRRWRATLGVGISVLVINLAIRCVAVEILFNYDPTPASHENFIRYIYTLMPANLDTFICGFLTNYLIIYLNDRKRNTEDRDRYFLSKPIGQILQYFRPGCKGLQVLAGIGTIATFALSAWWKTNHNMAVLSFGPTSIVITTCLFILAFDGGDHYENYRHNRRLSLRSCCQNPWRFGEILGVLSFGIYVWHYPLALRFNSQLLPPISSEVESFVWRCFVNITTSALLAAVSYVAIERPVSKWVRRRG